MSSVPVQFLVHVVSPPICTNPPDIVGIPLEQSCTPIAVGQPYSSQIQAINNCPATTTIADIATLSFTGMIKGNLVRVSASLYYKTLSWTPTSSQLGF